MSTRRFLHSLLAASAVFLFAIFAGLPIALAEDASPPATDSPSVVQVADVAPVATATAATPDPVAAVALGGVAAVAGSGFQVSPAAPGGLPPEVALIGVLATLAVAALKKYAPNIPGRWLPFISTAFGLLIEQVLSRAGITHGVGWLGGIAGGVAGVGIREHVDQLKKATGLPAINASIALFLAIGLVGGAGLLGSGCAVGRTIISRDTTTQSMTTNGIVLTSTVREETRTTAKTLADAKFAQHAFRASQSSKTQTIGIGDQSQESTSDAVDKLGNLLGALGRLAAATQGIPVPQAAPQVAPAPRAAAQPAYQIPPPEAAVAPALTVAPAVLRTVADPALRATNAPAAK